MEAVTSRLPALRGSRNRLPMRDEIPLDVDAQTTLDDPITIRWTGRLRDRIEERHWDYAATKDGDEWVVSDDADPKPAAVYRALTRQKTNLVIKTTEEAWAAHTTFGHYRSGGGREGITWMNGMMVKAIRRVSTEIMEGMRERGYEPVWRTTDSGWKILEGFEEVSD